MSVFAVLFSTLVGYLVIVNLFPKRWLNFLMDKVLHALLGQNIIYNVAVEDPRQDKELLELTPEDVVCMITTGSCNVMDRIVDGPRKVVAVDYNITQNHLLELRLACVRNMTHAEMWAVWGDGDITALRAKFPAMRNDMTKEAGEYWSTRMENVAHWQHRGSAGRVVQVMLFLTRHLLGIGNFLDNIGNYETLEEQIVAYELARPRLEPFIFFFWNVFEVISPFIGVPSQQLLLCEGNLLMETMDNVFMKTHIASENYVYLGYLTGKYSTKCRPRYLTPEGFAALKTNITTGKTIVDIHTDMLNHVATGLPKGEITVVILLDSMDWMQDQMVEDQLDLLRTCLHPTRGRVLWRSASKILTHPALMSLDIDYAKVEDVTTRIPCMLGSYPGTFFGRFVPGRSWSRVADMPFPNNGFMTDMQVMRAMYMASADGEDQAQRLDAFYAKQADLYDGYRQHMLHGRGPMIKAVPLKEGSKVTWVDFGCGTGSNFELIESQFVDKAVGLDLCQSLLNVAEERAKKLKFEGGCDLVNADVCKPTTLAANSADVVTFSYSLSMIPDWRAAIQEGLRVLKPGGYLAVADFTESRHRGKVNNFFWKRTFATDHVYLNRDHRSYLQEVTHRLYEQEGEGSFPYIPYLKAPFYSFLGTKPTTA